MVKNGIRVIGIDDSPFEKFVKKDIIVVGAVYRGGSFLEGLLTTKIRIDGRNSTRKIVEMICNSKFYTTLKVIMLDGIAFGGFNIIDIEALHKKTSLPVIVVVRQKPNLTRIKEILIKIGKKSQIKFLEKAGAVVKINNIFVQRLGISLDDAKGILKLTTTHSNVPEPLRIAHIIAGGLTTGESKGRA